MSCHAEPMLGVDRGGENTEQQDLIVAAKDWRHRDVDADAAEELTFAC